MLKKQRQRRKIICEGKRKRAKHKIKEGGPSLWVERRDQISCLECCSTCEYAMASLVDDQDFLAFDGLLRGPLTDVDSCFKEPPCL